jgi:hypothetical protein
MPQNIITLLKTGEETYETWSEWQELKPSESERHAFFAELLTLQNAPDFEVAEHFVELWELVENVFEERLEADLDWHWQIRKMLYAMAIYIELDAQSVVEIWSNFAEAIPNHQEAMRLYLDVAQDEEWYISDFEETLAAINDAGFKAECAVQYAKIILNHSARSGKFPQEQQQRVLALIRNAKTEWQPLPWASVADIFMENGFQKDDVVDLKQFFLENT